MWEKRERWQYILDGEVGRGTSRTEGSRAHLLTPRARGTGADPGLSCLCPPSDLAGLRVLKGDFDNTMR